MLLLYHLFFSTFAYASTICNDGWVSESEGQGTCSHHGGIYTGSQPITAICQDRTVSFSTIKQGACSHHGGILYWFGSEYNASAIDSYQAEVVTQAAEDVGEGVAGLGGAILEDEGLRDIALAAGLITATAAGTYIVVKKVAKYKQSDKYYLRQTQKMLILKEELGVTKKNIELCDTKLQELYDELALNNVSKTVRKELLDEVQYVKGIRLQQYERWNEALWKASLVSEEICKRFQECTEYKKIKESGKYYD